MKVEKQPSSRLTKDSRQPKKVRGDSKSGARVRRPKRECPSQLSNQHEHDQANFGTGADQLVDAVEALPTPPAYEPTAKEQLYLARHEKRKDNTPPTPSFEFEHDWRGMRPVKDHPDLMTANKLLMEALATADPAFFAGLERQLIDLMEGEDEEGVKALNFVLSYIVNGRPEDPLETMHLVQMAIVDLALKRNAKEAFRIQRRFDLRLDNRAHPSPVKPRDSFERENEKCLAEMLAVKETAQRGIEKLARVSAQQLLALPRYRILKGIAKKLAGSEEVSRDPPINVNSGGNRGSTADQPVLGSKVVPLRRGVKS
jgi:hypothetical protein